MAFSLNGGMEVTATANIPATAVQPFVAVGNSAAVNKTLQVDYIDLLVPAPPSRKSGRGSTRASPKLHEWVSYPRGRGKRGAA